MKNSLTVVAAITLLMLSAPLGGWNAAAGPGLAKSVLPVQLQVPFVPPPFRTGSQVGLAYELHLTSFRNIELRLKQIDVFDMEQPNPALLTLVGPELRQCLLRPGKPIEFEDLEVLSGGDFAVIALWMTVDSELPFPKSLAHRATFRVVRSPENEKEHTVEGGLVQVPLEPPVTLWSPLPPGRWLMANGPSMRSEHRLFLHSLDGRASNTQRFASDWMLLGSDGRLLGGDPNSNADWHAYGVPILAVADAVVVDVGVGIPDNIPLSEERAVPNKRETMTGNYLVLQLADERFAFYGHLQIGSLLVKPGDRVRVGQKLGRIGNSGNSDAPHLHFHVANTADPLSGEGLPFALSSFAILDVLDVPFWERMVIENLPWDSSASHQSSLRTDEMPVGQAIIELQ